MSENILKELCNRVLSLFKQTESKEENAKEVACNRLRVVLMQDRTNLTPELLQRMRRELVELLSKYVEMDKDALELNFDQEGDQMALMLSIPVIRAKDEAEIEEALKTEEVDNETEDEEDSDSEEEISEENFEEDEASEEEVNEEIIEKNDENLQEDEATEENK
jgi:cell division topological specificity factor